MIWKRWKFMRFYKFPIRKKFIRKIFSSKFIKEIHLRIKNQPFFWPKSFSNNKKVTSNGRHKKTGTFPEQKFWVKKRNFCNFFNRVLIFVYIFFFLLFLSSAKKCFFSHFHIRVLKTILICHFTACTNSPNEVPVKTRQKMCENFQQNFNKKTLRF